MTKRTLGIAALIGTLMTGGIVATGAVAQSGPDDQVRFAHGDDDRRGGPGGFGFMGGGERMEFALAFAEERIGITEAQQPQWQALTAAIRAATDEAGAMRDAMRDMRAELDGERPSVAERLDFMAQRAGTMAQMIETVNAAFQPFYGSLDADQQATVNELVGMFGPGGRGGHDGPRGEGRGHHGWGHDD